jgi:putative oxidoreductase
MTSQQLSANANRSSSLLTRVFATDATIAAPALRLTLALTMFPHGAQKALGWFGGYGWDGTMGFLTQQIGMPGIAAAGVILLELLGPLLLLAGLGTRFVALGFIGLMLGAIKTVHAQHGFFMNWTGSQAGEGFEYHILLIGAAIALVFAGGGRWSVDRRLSYRS